MLFKISFKNIKKSVKDYAIYFFTLIVGVAIFYVFNSIEKQTVMLNITSDQREIIKIIVDMLSYVSVFVSFILGFLIIYASRFLIKRRNKEFGIYLLLGMGKRKISTILFIETLLIGLISLAVGLGVGVFASQFMSIFIANTFEADMSSFAFVFSSDACIKTIMYFGIMYLIVMVFNIFIIGKCKLIDLMQAGRKSERIRMKNPIVCIIVFIIAVFMLLRAYYMVTDGIGKIIRNPDNLLVAIILGAVATFLIFWSVSGLLLKMAMAVKKVYYNGLNSFMIRQISSKVNTTVFSMTIICLMLFITICVLSVSTSIKKSLEDRIEKYCKADIEISSGFYDYDETLDDLKFNGENNVFHLYEQAGYDVKSYFDEYVEYYTYNVYSLSDDNEEDIAEVITLSDYNKAAGLMGNSPIELKEDEYVILATNGVHVSRYNKLLSKNHVLEINHYSLTPKYDKCVDGVIALSDGPGVGITAYIVPDIILKGCEPTQDTVIANYAAKTKKEKREIEDKIRDMDVEYGYMTSKIEAYDANVGIGTMFIFLGSYLGVVFLISGAAILALKELSESTDNIERYAVLRKIGADEAMIHHSLFGQIGIFFALPLVLAVIHSIVGIKFSMMVVSMFVRKEELISGILATSGIIVAIYGGYFLLTYLCSKQIIKSRV